MMHNQLVLCWVIVATTAYNCFADVGSQPADEPNILFIYLDDLGWKDTGYMGSDFFETPHIDKLAAEGMAFTDAYSCAANCAPARACLLSGQYTPRHQLYNVGTKPRGKSAHRRIKHIPGVDHLDPQIRTWAHQLKAAGYKTASIGKWHLSGDPKLHGFDINVGGTHSGSPPNGYYPPHGQAPGLADALPGEYLTDRLNQEAIKFITEHRSSRWCLYLTHFAVHTPLNPKKELVEKYKSKPTGKLHSNVAMATMIESVDRGVGRILATLEQLKLREKTIVLFYSDNGGFGPATDMNPLKGYKGTYYEGGIRVPFAANWPGKIKAGVTCDIPITGVDFFPTFCELANVKMPSTHPFDGISLLDLLLGKTARLPERSLFWHFPAYLQSYSQVVNEQRDVLFRSRPCSVIRKGNWKLHQFFEQNEFELYDLENDIGEMNNLVEKRPEKALELRKELHAWQKKIMAPTEFEPNPGYDAQSEAEAIKRKLTKAKSLPQSNSPVHQMPIF